MSRRILFVCLGNICRSPLAEGIFLHIIKERGLESRYAADSAGIGDWHIGEPPDRRAAAAAQRHGVKLPSVCRQVDASDFIAFDCILAMDRNNRRDLLMQCPPELRGRVRMMRDFDEDSHRGADVPDPYYGGPYEFNHVYEMLHRCCGRLIDALESGEAVPSAAGDAAP